VTGDTHTDCLLNMTETQLTLRHLLLQYGYGYKASCAGLD